MNGWLLALLITAAILGILMLLRFGVRVEYFPDETRVFFCISRLRIRVYSSMQQKNKKKKSKKSSRKNGKKPSDGKDDGKKAKKERKKPDLSAVLSLVKDGGGVFLRLVKKIRVEELRASVTVGGPDAAEAAIRYGRLWAAVGAVHALLDNLVTVKTFDVNVLLDFDERNIRTEGILELGFRNLYIMAAVYGAIRALWKHRDLFRGSGGSPQKTEKNTGAYAVSGGEAAEK